MIVFSEEWFEKYQKQLLWFANTRWGRYVLRIHGDRSDVGKNKIEQIYPGAIKWREGREYKMEFRTHAKYAKRFYYAFKPLWWLMHYWDMVVANNLNQALNLGFDTINYYPSSSNDANTLRDGVDQTFSSIRAGAATDVFSELHSGSNYFAAVTLGVSPAIGTANHYSDLWRFIMCFNTSAIPDTATISSATLAVYGYFKDNGLGSPSLNICSSNPSNVSSIALGDHTTLGSTSFGSVSYSSFSTSAYNTVTLNASGLSNLSASGYSKFGARTSWDLNNSFTGSWTANANSTFWFHIAEQSGTSKDEKLTVTYTLQVFAAYNNANPYADGKLRENTGSGWADVTTSDLYFETYSAEGDTTVVHSSEDPSDILRAILDYFNTNGGSVTYDVNSIDDTNTSVSYTFVTQTVLEAINKVLELAPADWYWYVDPATNLLHFHEKNETTDHRLAMGRDIERLEVQKRSEDIINTIYFTGGDVGGGSILYKKYQNSTSVGLYGLRADRIIDERVIIEDTAEKMANRILNLRSVPEIRLVTDLADSNSNSQGFDIESINVGDIVTVLNVKGNTGSSLWDVAIWDVDRFVYTITQLGTMLLQISRKEYTPSKLSFICSSIPPEISKRIEDINRNLEASQTVNNPDEPS